MNTQKLAGIFYPSWFAFQDLSTEQIVAVGKGFRNLYTYQVSAPSVSFQDLHFPVLKSPFLHNIVCNSSAVINSVSSLNVFHDRLGHTSLSKMVHIDECKKFDTSVFTCETCMLAKHHRLPFTRSTSHSLIPLELIHVDLWGPYKTPALNGAKYFFTIVDDHTLLGHIFCIQKIK